MLCLSALFKVSTETDQSARCRVNPVIYLATCTAFVTHRNKKEKKERLSLTGFEPRSCRMSCRALSQ